MKRFLVSFLVLTLTLSFLAFPASADVITLNYDKLYAVKAEITGVCEMTPDPDDPDCYNIVIDTNTTIVLKSIIDALEVFDSTEKGGERYYVFSDGEQMSEGTCTVTYTPGTRLDSADSGSPEVDLENEVTYMQEGATIRFNRPGEFGMFAILGVADGYDRMSQFEKAEGENYLYYMPHRLLLDITVKEETSSESIEDIEYYDKSIFEVEGITGYDRSREIMGDNLVAICSAPVTITAKDNLMNMAISKIEMVDGEWTDVRYIDGEGINLGDPSKNWLPGMGYKGDFSEPYFEYTGDKDFIDGFVPVDKGTGISLAEPGLYSVWGETNNGGYTGLTFEICDSTATYTNSKVLVDGKEVKFEAYNINDNNYFKLRDIAYVLTDCEYGGVRFNVKWDGERNMINLLSEQDYEAVGGELKEGDGKDKPFQRSKSALLKDGYNVSLNAYLINENNYFKLRDLGQLFDFNVSWDGANNCILIDPRSSYIEP